MKIVYGVIIIPIDIKAQKITRYTVGRVLNNLGKNIIVDYTKKDTVYLYEWEFTSISFLGDQTSATDIK